MNELKQIEARANEATGPQWDVEHEPNSTELYFEHGYYGVGPAVVTKQADATFLAHAREDVPALVAEVRRLQSCEATLECRVLELEATIERALKRAEKGSESEALLRSSLERPWRETGMVQL